MYTYVRTYVYARHDDLIKLVEIKVMLSRDSEYNSKRNKHNYYYHCYLHQKGHIIHNYMANDMIFMQRIIIP